MKRVVGVATALLLTGVGLTSAPSTQVASAVGVGPVQTDVVSADGVESRRASINELARDVRRAESLREVKDVQRTFAQLSQFGRWQAMSSLFADDGSVVWGEETTTGRRSIAAWLEQEAGAMNGRNPGSLHTEHFANPIVNLSVDGHSAEARWSVRRSMGDGKGNTRIEGGIYENEYVLEGGRWRIATLHYYPQYEGDYANAWTNVDGEKLPVVPYHFTPDSAGVPIPEPTGRAPRTRSSVAELAARISRLNDEDSVRNLQHAYGYYVDRRMWDDVVDLFADRARVKIDGEGVFHGRDGVRRAMEQTMGPDGLTQSTLNEHPMFGTIVDVLPGGKKAIARGTQLGLLEDPTTRKASWQFSVFRNTFVKRGGLWRLQELDITPLMTADYADGWGDGGTTPEKHRAAPAFLNVSRKAAAAELRRSAARGHDPRHELADLTRRLDRSKAYDGAVNVNSVYTTFLDDNNCAAVGQIHAQHGHKSSPGAGYYLGPDRIDEACAVFYGHTPPTSRSGISFHWEPQPVILVSHDGRSANIRTRLFKMRTATSTTGSFFRPMLAGAMYNNQAVLEDGIWRLWDTTIDEEYWGMDSWDEGWAGVEPRDPDAPPPPPRDLIEEYPPDLLLADMGEREQGLWGGTGTFIEWPDIVPMWFNYRNLVSGRVPEHYQSDCAPCGVKPSWSMVHYGYQLPPNGPSNDGVNIPVTPH